MERSRKLQLEWARKTVNVIPRRIKGKNGRIILTELFGNRSPSHYKHNNGKTAIRLDLSTKMQTPDRTVLEAAKNKL